VALASLVAGATVEATVAVPVATADVAVPAAVEAGSWLALAVADGAAVAVPPPVVIVVDTSGTVVGDDLSVAEACVEVAVAATDGLACASGVSSSPPQATSAVSKTAVSADASALLSSGLRRLLVTS